MSRIDTNPSNASGHSVVAAPLPPCPLARLIAHEIRERGGWMSFERYMELALYTPGLGYYSGGKRVLGQGPQDGSDFVTAPEMSPLFGRTVARQIEQALEHTDTDQVWEFGAGTGALAEQILGEIGDRIQRYTIVDLSGTLRERQHARIAQAHPALAHKVIWADELPEEINGVIVGNEVLDAIPVHLLAWNGEVWLERGVTVTSADEERPTFAWAERPLPEGVRPPTDRPDSDFVPGTVVETHGPAEAFVATLATRMARGAAFFLDYGFPAEEFYLPQRLSGTLMCHQAHRSDPDPLDQVGQKDITTHVNFTGVALAGQEGGWEVLGYTTQAHFLMNCGLLGLLPAQGEVPTADDVRATAAVQKLLGEHEMGELFKVIGFTKGAWFDALGFRQGDRTHTL